MEERPGPDRETCANDPGIYQIGQRWSFASVFFLRSLGTMGTVETQLWNPTMAGSGMAGPVEEPKMTLDCLLQED